MNLNTVGNSPARAVWYIAIRLVKDFLKQGYNALEFSSARERVMTKERNAKKEAKKEPAMTPKEKKAMKKAKKEAGKHVHG